jgi:hypothetical protein
MGSHRRFRYFVQIRALNGWFLTLKRSIITVSCEEYPNFKIDSHSYCMPSKFTSSLGVHISFVRSIAMDSWTPQQLAQMTTGGNKKCNDFLQQRGIGARDPIKAKYESDAAQLYKAVLKARVEGKPEPTVVPKPAPRSEYRPSTTQTSFGSQNNSVGNTSSNNPVQKEPSNDPNGMERMAGESESAYVARQTRLREEAKARMAAKFGSAGIAGRTMGGVGSDPNYNQSGGYGDMGVGSLIGGVTNLMGTVTSVVDTDAIKHAGGSFWSSLTSAASGVATTLTQPGGDDGLAALQQEFAQKKPVKSAYSGFGSDQPLGTATISGSAERETVQECPGLPGEDRNGIQRLSGESDAQYVARQTRLREEARERMAAKFGGGGLSGVGSTPQPTSSSFQPGGSNTPPRSRSPPPNRTPPKKMNSGDFFESFGS